MKENKGFKETEIGLIPEDWEVVRLGEVFEVKQGKQLSSKESKEGKTLKPFLRTSNILWNRIDVSNLSYMPFSNKEFEVLKLCKGDILVCEGGDVGRTAVWEGQLEECAYQNHLHRLRPKENNIVNYFFSYWMEYAISLRGLYISIANKTTIPNLSSQRLKSFLIPLPPLDEQKAIADILSTVQNAIEKTEKVINATKQLKKSMMKHLFTYGAVAVDKIDKVKLKESEIGLIPEHWEVVRLENVMEGFTPNKKLKQSDYKAIGKFPVIDQGQEYVAGFYDDETMVFDKDLPVILFGDHTRIIKYVDFPFICGADGLKIIIPKENFHRKYFYYALLNLNIPSRGYNRHFKILKEKLIPLPPLDEQKAIADILSTVQNAIEKTEKVINATKQLKKSIMKHLFTYGAVAVDEIDRVKLKESEIGLIPEDWKVVRLRDIVNFKIGRTPPRKNKDYWTNGKYYWVSISDMKNPYINNTSEMVSEKAHKEIFKEKLTPAGTLLMSFKLTIGRTVILNVDAYHNEAIISIFPKENKVLKEFLFYYLPAVDYSNLQDKVVKGNTLNTSKLNKIPIPLPPLDEQQKIANILTTIDQKIQAEEKKKQTLQNLFKTLLQQLMTGKIRVKKTKT